MRSILDNKNKRGQFGFTFTALIVAIIVIVCLIAFFAWPKARWIITGVGLIIAGIWLGGKVVMNPNPSKIAVVIIAILIILGIASILASSVLNTALEQTALGGTGEVTSTWQKSIIPCTAVADCSSYLLKQGVSQDELNTAEFKCESKLCYFKSK